MAAFNASTIVLGNENIANFNVLLRHITNHVFPARALQTQKRYMRQMMVKPRTTTVRKYAVRLAEINGYLNDFPTHQSNQAIPVDKLLEILEFAIPVGWQHQMTRNGIDPLQQTFTQFVQFYECLESTENIPSGNGTKRGCSNEKDEAVKLMKH